MINGLGSGLGSGQGSGHGGGRAGDWLRTVEQTVVGLGYDLVDFERAPGGLLRVYIDVQAPSPSVGRSTEEAFVTIDDCERVSRQLQHVLEVENVSYQRLEVSSPGLDRALRKVADYQRFTGAQVEITLKTPFQGRKRYRGELTAADSGWRIVFNDGKAEQALDFGLDEVREARLVPVLDFKGRRSAAPPAEAGSAAERTDGTNGGPNE